MKAKFKWVIVALAVVFIGVMAYSSLQATKDQYRVCMDFRGRSHCAVAEGRTPREAMRSAMEIDCGLIAGDRTQLMVCEASQPSSVQVVPK